MPRQLPIHVAMTHAADERGRPRRGWRTAAAVLAAALLLLSAPAEAQRRGGGGAGTSAGPSHSERIDSRYGRDRSGRSGDQGARDPFAADDPLLAAARDHQRDHPEDFVRSEQFRDDLPFLRVRLPRSTFDYDPSVMDLAQRLTTQLDRRLSIEGITIIEADFSPRAEVQDMASRDFRASIPAARRQLPPTLGALQRGGEARPSVEQIRQALAPLRGQVLILAGHIDPTDETMSWTGGGRRSVIDLRLWLEAADRAGVMLLPLGCYSALYSRVGSRFALNSRELVASLAAMLAAEPASYAEMYRSLAAAEGLTLDLDPFQATLVYEKIDIFSDAGVQGAVYWNPGLLQRDSAAGGVGPDPMRPCGDSRDVVELARCSAANAAAEPIRSAESSVGYDQEQLDKDRRQRWIGLIIFLAAIFPIAGLAAMAMRSRLMPDDDWEPGDPLAEMGEDWASDRPFLADYRVACLWVGPLCLAALAVGLAGSGAGTIALDLDFALWGAAGLVFTAWRIMKTGKPLWFAFALALGAAAYLPYAGAVRHVAYSSALVADAPARIARACAELGADARYIAACRR